MASRTSYQLQPGCPVFTSDGDHLGKVKEVSGESFKVDVPWRPDYWLARDTVMSVDTSGRVVLGVRSDDLERYERDVPRMGPYGQGQHYAGGQRDMYRWSEPYDDEAAGYERFDRGGAWDWEGTSYGSGGGRRPMRPGATTWQGEPLGRYSSEGEIDFTDRGRTSYGTYRSASFESGSAGPWTGRGPKGYRRSDDAIRDDICDRLTRHGDIDATDVDIQVTEGEVTLTGHVQSRYEKRLAEDLAEDLPGVQQVHNQLKAESR